MSVTHGAERMIGRILDTSQRFVELESLSNVLCPFSAANVGAKNGVACKAVNRE